MGASDVEVVCEASDTLGESPVWDAEADALWWVDIHGRALRRWRAGAAALDTWTLPEQTGSIGLTHDGDLVAATRTGFGRLDVASGRLTMVATPLAGARDVRFNDGRCDRAGRFWSATVQEARVPGGAALYRFDPDETCTRVLGDMTVGNGIAWSPDDATMYVADSHVREIHAYAFDAERGWPVGRRIFARMEHGMPDGATVDAEGALWVAAIGGGCLVRYAPDGRVDRRIDMPVTQPTSVEFGGPGLATLFVTSARMRLADDELARQPHAGALFALDVGVPGLPTPRYGEAAP